MATCGIHKAQKNLGKDTLQTEDSCGHLQGQDQVEGATVQGNFKVSNGGVRSL